MAERKHITLELQQMLGPVFIHVPLPLDAKARAWVDDQLERVRICIKKEHMAEFREKLNWLPTTMEQLETAERLHRAGHNYHDACARSLSEDMIVWITIGELEKLHGHPGMCRNCPVALAVQKVLLPGFVVEVGLTHVSIVEPRDSVRETAIGGFALTADMSAFIRAFDAPGGYSEARPFTALAKLPRRAVRPGIREAMSCSEWLERNQIAAARTEGLSS